MAFNLSSPAFASGGNIPTQYTCEGDGRSPPLAWSAVPEGTRSLALIVDDPDAPDPAKPLRVFVHWVLYNLSPDAGGLPEGVRAADLPGVVGINGWHQPGYGGPCPPIGRHRYFFKLYALDALLPDLGPATKPALEQAMTGHVLAQAELVGTYQKQGT